MKWHIPDNTFIRCILITCLYSGILFSFFIPLSLGQTDESKTLSTYGSIVAAQPEQDPPSTEGQVYVVGNQLYDADGNPLHLAGAVKAALAASVSAAQPGNRHGKEIMFQKLSDAGGNFVVFAMNSELWTHQEYRSYIDTYVQWCRKHRLYYQFKVQAIGEYNGGTYPTKFSRAGSNWMVTLPENAHYKTRLINMWTDLVTLYGDDPNFVGLSLLNEPWGNMDESRIYEKWKPVRDYYLEAIDAVTAIDPNCIFFVMEPWSWGSSGAHWNDPANPYRGYLERPNVVYEFHVYYHHWDDRGWGLQYSSGNFAQGDVLMRQWHEERVGVVQDDGYPVFNGEFGPYGAYPDVQIDGRTPVTNYQRAHQGQIQDMNALGIHYSQYCLYALSEQQYGMINEDGTDWSGKGQVLVNNLPPGLPRP
jgi:hypothetical protein